MISALINLINQKGNIMSLPKTEKRSILALLACLILRKIKTKHVNNSVFIMEKKMKIGGNQE